MHAGARPLLECASAPRTCCRPPLTWLAGTPACWRFILAVAAAVGALQGVLLLGIPESPKFLMSIGDRNGARAALARLRGSARAGEIEDAVREEEPLTGADDDAATKVSLYEFATRTEHRGPALVVAGLMLAQQLTGINAVIFHGVAVLQALLPDAAGSINVMISVANVLITAAASTCFDRVSHKLLLVVSMLGMAASALLLALGLAHGVAALSATAAFAFVGSFSVGLGPLPWMVASKTVSYRAVDAAQSAGLVASWIGTFIVAFGVPIIPPVVSFVVFGLIGFFSAAMVYWKVDAY